MKDLIRAALGQRANRLLLLDTSKAVVQTLVRRPETTFAAIAKSSPKALKSSFDLAGASSVSAVIGADLPELPFKAQFFDAVIVGEGQLRWEDPVAWLRSLRAFARHEGAVMVVSQLREGPIGGVTSVVKRVANHRTLPRASDLTSWMLLAGLRKVRQANVPSAVIPTVVTWAEVRNRPWESEGPSSTA